MVACAATALAFSCFGPATAADPLSRYDGHDTGGLMRVDGPTYLNGNYGYAVRVPTGQTAWMTKPPSPNHGFSVYLGPRRSIEVDASFDSALLGSTSAVADNEADHVQDAHDTKSSETLGNRTAERVVQSWPGGDRRRVIVTRWDDPGGPADAIVFTLSLETTVSDYGHDLSIFEALVKSFRFVPRKS